MKTLQVDLERAFTSVGFVIAVVGTIIALFAGSFTGLWVNMDIVQKEGLSFGYHWQLLNRGLQSEAFSFAIPILATLGFGGAYLEDMKSGYYKFALPRYGRRRYVIAKVMTSFLSGGVSVWLGVLFTALIEWSVYAPMEQNMETALLSGNVANIMYTFADGAVRLEGGGIYGVTLEQAAHSNMLLALLQWSALVFLTGATWASLSCLFAILYQNRYMAYGASFLVSYLIIIVITRFFNSIYIFNPREWFNQTYYWEGGNLGVMAFLLECVVLLNIVNAIMMDRKNAAK
jgi:hypothetical protein